MWADEIKYIVDNLNWVQVDRLRDLIKSCDRLFILGVGGSAANASHAVNDFRKIMGKETYSPVDNVAELTAYTNDVGWDYVFNLWLDTSRLNSKDMVLILSVNGGTEKVSKNLVNAIDFAKERGAKIGGITGYEGGYTFVNADVCVRVPEVKGMITPYTESFQTLILHLICK